jgi:hypothetical protein
MLAGCGGGGSSESGEISSGDPFPAKILSWAPPSQYTDGSSLDPVTDLDRFEIYIKEGADFSNADDEIAAVSATNPGTGQINTSFNLANLAPFLSQGVTYHVSVRTVALSGLKSDFSPSATFSF